jgi:hypothetical protein
VRRQSDYLPLRCSRLRREALQEAKPNTTRQRSQMSRSSICPVVAFVSSATRLSAPSSGHAHREPGCTRSSGLPADRQCLPSALLHFTCNTASSPPHASVTKPQLVETRDTRRERTCRAAEQGETVAASVWSDQGAGTGARCNEPQRVRRERTAGAWIRPPG